MAKMKVMGGGATCTCTPGGLIWLILGVIVFAIGFWLVIKTLLMQWGGSTDWMRLVFWYALGFLVICFGKVLKCKACGYCFNK